MSQMRDTAEGSHTVTSISRSCAENTIDFHRHANAPAHGVFRCAGLPVLRRRNRWKALGLAPTHPLFSPLLIPRPYESSDIPAKETLDIAWATLPDRNSPPRPTRGKTQTHQYAMPAVPAAPSYGFMSGLLSDTQTLKREQSAGCSRPVNANLGP